MIIFIIIVIISSIILVMMMMRHLGEVKHGWGLIRMDGRAARSLQLIRISPSAQVA